MVKKGSKAQAQKEIEDFFKKLEGKTPKGVKKIKKLAMAHNIKLGEKRKLFCKKCFAPHENPSVRIKNDMMNIICDNCEHKNRWKIE